MVEPARGHSVQHVVGSINSKEKSPRFYHFLVVGSLSSDADREPLFIGYAKCVGLRGGKIAWSIIYRDITSILLLIALRDILLSVTYISLAGKNALINFQPCCFFSSPGPHKRAHVQRDAMYVVFRTTTRRFVLRASHLSPLIFIHS